MDAKTASRFVVSRGAERDVKEFEKELHSEIERIVIRDDLPEAWTYPEIQPFLMQEVQKRITDA